MRRCVDALTRSCVTDHHAMRARGGHRPLPPARVLAGLAILLLLLSAGEAKKTKKKGKKKKGSGSAVHDRPATLADPGRTLAEWQAAAAAAAAARAVAAPAGAMGSRWTPQAGGVAAFASEKPKQRPQHGSMGGGNGAPRPGALDSIEQQLQQRGVALNPKADRLA